jgi:16S rRNA (adenine1518-N6/adenine1519-N6)-dimethyltransferase
MSIHRRTGHVPDDPPVRKSLGQHFLNDRKILERIADAADLTGTETVLEIGPGRGALTDVLLTKAGRLIAIEYDRALAGRLRERYADRPNVEIVQSDVLALNLGEVAHGAYRLIGNVPYYITTPILFHALTAPRPDIAVYLIQREVADRLAANPGTKAYGALSVNVRAVATVEVLFHVPSGAFRPPPKIESAVIRIVPLPTPIVAPEREERFRSFVQACFTMRRKQMQRVLRSIRGLEADESKRILTEVSIDPTLRPESLSPADFARLEHHLSRLVPIRQREAESF